MTKEQKIVFLEKMGNDTLLQRYSVLVKHDEGKIEDIELAKTELLRRMENYEGRLEKAKAYFFETACKASICERKAKDIEKDKALVSQYNDIYLRTILTINLLFGLDVEANPSFLAHSYMAYIRDRTSGEILYRFYE